MTTILTNAAVASLLTDAQARAIECAAESLLSHGWEVDGSDGLNLNHLEAEEANKLQEMPRNPWFLAYPKGDSSDDALVVEVHPNGAARIYDYHDNAAGRPYVQLDNAIDAVEAAWRSEFGA